MIKFMYTKRKVYLERSNYIIILVWNAPIFNYADSTNIRTGNCSTATKRKSQPIRAGFMLSAKMLAEEGAFIVVTLVGKA